MYNKTYSKRIIFSFIFIFFTLSCNSIKYTINFEKGRYLNFSSGKWILNTPLTNIDRKVVDERFIYSFKEVVKDSAYLIEELRVQNVFINSIPYNLTDKELKLLKEITDFNYLVNIKVDVIREEINGITVPSSFDTSLYEGTKINEAKVELIIYNLDTREIISSSETVGREEITPHERDGLGYINNAQFIALKCIDKICKEYNKNSILKKAL